MDKIAFIGGGNMASAIIGGMIASGWAPSRITVVDPNADQRDRLTAQHGVTTTDDVANAAAADIIVLAVKPQVITSVAEQLGADLSGKLIFSIVAGVSIATLEGLFGPVAIARTMPNTPALLGLGATGLYVNERASEAQRVAAKGIIEAFGICVAVEREDLLDAVTAVSGSGPAYYFLMIEEMIRAGTALGLRPEDAKALTLQTALGAATMPGRWPAGCADLGSGPRSGHGRRVAGSSVCHSSCGLRVGSGCGSCRQALSFGSLHLARG